MKSAGAVKKAFGEGGGEFQLASQSVVKALASLDSARDALEIAILTWIALKPPLADEDPFDLVIEDILLTVMPCERRPCFRVKKVHRIS